MSFTHQRKIITKLLLECFKASSRRLTAEGELQSRDWQITNTQKYSRLLVLIINVRFGTHPARVSVFAQTKGKRQKKRKPFAD